MCASVGMRVCCMYACLSVCVCMPVYMCVCLCFCTHAHVPFCVFHTGKHILKTSVTFFVGILRALEEAGFAS